MKIYLLISLLIYSMLYSQDRLYFVKDKGVKKEIQKSIDFLNKTEIVPEKIKNKVIFITFDIEKVFEREMCGFNYSTSIPLSLGILNQQGQFIHHDSHNKVIFYNYSPNIVLFFRVFEPQGENRYFDNDEMKKASNEIQINKKNLIQSEFFQYEKGNSFTADTVNNFISLDRINGEFIPVRVNTFDLKTFMEVWYGIDVKEIPVSHIKSMGIGRDCGN